MDYDSGRSKNDIVNYMKKKSGPVAVTYTTKDDLETAIDAVEVAIVGYFKDTECEQYKQWYNVMAALDDVTAIYITDEAIAKEMKVEMPAIVMYKTLGYSIAFTGEMKDLNKQIDDIFETIDVSEAILRIKEITGRQVSLSLPPHAQLPETLLKKQEMSIPPAMIGRIVGKNAATVPLIDSF